MDSILTSVKKMLGITEEYTQFDVDIIIHINSVFSILAQLGVGPSTGFSISDSEATWEDFLDGDVLLNDVKTYMYHKVRLLFDPPTSSAVSEVMKSMCNEFEWRMNVAAETEEDE